MKNKINNWAHRNLAEIVTAIFVMVLITMGISAYNLWDRKEFAEKALRNQDSIKVGQLVNRETATLNAINLRRKLDSINAIKK